MNMNQIWRAESECRMQMEEAALNYAQKEWKGEGKRDRPNLLITIGCHY